MPRSTLTRAEHKVAAKFMGEGWWYDERDHTYNIDNESGDHDKAFDADTMGPLYVSGDFITEFGRRYTAVLAGEIGACNAEK